MAVMTSISVATAPILARGRGLARLIEGLWNGDPVAWGISGVVIAVLVAIAVFKRATGTSDSDE